MHGWGPAKAGHFGVVRRDGQERGKGRELVEVEGTLGVSTEQEARVW